MTEKPRLTWWSSLQPLFIVIIIMAVVALCVGGCAPDPLAGCSSVTEYLDEHPQELTDYLNEKSSEFTDDYIKNYLESDQAIQEEIVQPYIDQYIQDNGYEIATQYVQDHPEEFQR